MKGNPKVKPLRLLLIALIGALAIAACSDTPDSVDDAVTSLPGEEDMAEAAADIQAEIEAVSTEIENSEAADDLRAAWSDIQVEINSAVDSVTSNETVDTEAIQAELDEFQAEVEAAGDEVSDELVAAWNELRSTFEELIS